MYYPINNDGKKSTMKYTYGNNKPFRLLVSKTFGKSGLLLLAAISLFSSCKDEYEPEIDMGSPIELSVSDQKITLSQEFMYNTAISFSWTSGTNQGTGSSISYMLELDIAGNDFASSQVYEMGKGVYEKLFTVDELNDLLLEEWGKDTGSSVSIEARITAKVSHESVDDDISAPVEFKVTSYDPVSETLYLLGDATPNGWDADNATPLTPDESNPTIFGYQGIMNEGDFIFITTLGQRLPAYTKGDDNTDLFYRTDESQPENTFLIGEKGMYSVSVNLLEETVSYELLPGPPYDVLYIIGSATSAGWDIANAPEVPQNPGNLYQFIYEGVLTEGEFKFPVNRNTDWQQDMFMRDTTDASKIYLHEGGNPDDNKWEITHENHYTITLDLAEYTIDIDTFELYIIGSATPVGWDIANAIELEQDPDEWYIFRYIGELGEGEFKFPVNRQTDWQQDMYMKDPDDPTKMYRHVGGEEDDNKWTLTAEEAGNYILTLNIEELTIDIAKQ